MNLINTDISESIIFEILHGFYPMVQYKLFRDDARMRYVLGAQVESPGGETWRLKLDIDDLNIERASDPNSYVVGGGFILTEELIKLVPIDKIGAYPFARIWIDLHNQKSLKKYPRWLWHPERDVPGWVFSRAYKEGGYPEDASAKKVVKEQDIELPSSFQNDQLEKMKEALNMATASSNKKKVVKRQITRGVLPGFDPSKVKAPVCAVHGSEMVFDKIEQKWCCTDPNCTIVARPKRDADDKNVVLGKGGIQLRLVAQDSGISVVLISDDNIALNITKFVDIDEILEVFDVKTQAKVASDTGKEVFSTPTEHSISMTARLVVMGADELTE